MNPCPRCCSNNTTTYTIGERHIVQCLACAGRFVGDDTDEIDRLIEDARRDLRIILVDDDDCKPLENIDAAIARLDGGALPLLSSFPASAERDALARDTGFDADRIAIVDLHYMEAWLAANNTTPPDWGEIDPSRRVLVFPIPNYRAAVIGLDVNKLLSSTAS